MKVVLASRNKKKIAEMQSLLHSEISRDIQVLSLDDIGYYDEIEENGSTFEENSKIKASVPASMGYIGIADDSGLVVDALNGEPGVYSARYAGEDCDDGANNSKLLKALNDIPYDKRTASFVSVVTMVAPDGDSISVRGECNGYILSSPRGDDGFGYDPLFYYPGFDKTFAQMSSREKNSVSHRGKAMENFAKEFSKFIKNYDR